MVMYVRRNSSPRAQVPENSCLHLQHYYDAIMVSTKQKCADVVEHKWTVMNVNNTTENRVWLNASDAAQVCARIVKNA